MCLPHYPQSAWHRPSSSTRSCPSWHPSRLQQSPSCWCAKLLCFLYLVCFHSSTYQWYLQALALPSVAARGSVPRSAGHCLICLTCALSALACGVAKDGSMAPATRITSHKHHTMSPTGDGRPRAGPHGQVPAGFSSLHDRAQGVRHSGFLGTVGQARGREWLATLSTFQHAVLQGLVHLESLVCSRQAWEDAQRPTHWYTGLWPVASHKSHTDCAACPPNICSRWRARRSSRAPTSCCSSGPSCRCAAALFWQVHTSRT